MAINIPIITEYVGAGVDKAIREFKQLETTGEKAQFAIKKAAVPAAAALVAVGAAAFDAVKGAMEDAAAQEQLARNIRGVTNASDTLTLGITLGATDVVTVYASTATMSFAAFGSEIA